MYEIGYAIEDPFQGTLRLSIMCDTIRRDVYSDALHRKTAFDLQDRQVAAHKNDQTEEMEPLLPHSDSQGDGIDSYQ